jgi:hypothetical protein
MSCRFKKACQLKGLRRTMWKSVQADNSDLASISLVVGKKRPHHVAHLKGALSIARRSHQRRQLVAKKGKTAGKEKTEMYFFPELNGTARTPMDLMSLVCILSSSTMQVP